MKRLIDMNAGEFGQLLGSLVKNELDKAITALNSKVKTKQEPEKKILTLAEVALKYRIAEGTIYNWITGGKSSIPFFRTGSSIKFNSAKLEQWFENRKGNK